jgi:hypothetical protein
VNDENIVDEVAEDAEQSRELVTNQQVKIETIWPVLMTLTGPFLNQSIRGNCRSRDEGVHTSDDFIGECFTWFGTELDHQFDGKC